jgi:hypothetical protein
MQIQYFFPVLSRHFIVMSIVALLVTNILLLILFYFEVPFNYILVSSI